MQEVGLPSYRVVVIASYHGIKVASSDMALRWHQVVVSASTYDAIALPQGRIDVPNNVAFEQRDLI